MSANVIRRIVEVFIGLFVAVAALAALRNILRAFDGEFGTVSSRVSAGGLTDVIGLSDGASIAMTHGNLIVSDQPIAHAIDLLSSSAIIVLFVVALLAVRRLLIRFSEGDLFNYANQKSLHRIGMALLIACGISLVSTLALQPMILSAVQAPQDIVLHPSISWNVPDAKNVWLDYSVPVFTFILGGIALLFSQAFSVGLAYREDSESVV